MTQVCAHEAKAKFSELLSTVARSREPIVIFRYGIPIAQLNPVPKPNRLETDPILSQVEIKGDLFDDESDDWEAME